MVSIFTKLRILKEEGKLHSALVRKLRTLFIIVAVLAGVVLYNVLFTHFTGYYLMVGALLALIGFSLGMLIFSRINVVSWNETEEIIMSEKMNRVGYAALILSIVFEISLRHYLDATFSVHVIPLLLCGVGGGLFGRAVGSLYRIHRFYVHQNN